MQNAGKARRGQVAVASMKVLQGLLLLGAMSQVSSGLCDISGFSQETMESLEAGLRTQLIEVWLTGTGNVQSQFTVWSHHVFTHRIRYRY